MALTRLHTVAFGFLGFVAGCIYSFGGLAIDTFVTLGWITSAETPGLSYGTVLAFGALVGMPVLFAAFGCVSGILVGLLYNTATWFIGLVR